jgi:cytoskeletal protein CcmA (bactofilin family)
MFGQTRRSWAARLAARWPAVRPAVAERGILGVLGDTARIEGTFEIADSIRVECEVAGELTVGGKLTIGEKGAVRARVETVDAVIRGRYEGDLVATGHVEITATGRVTGTITTNSLTIALGGYFDGTVARLTEDADPAPAPESEASRQPAAGESPIARAARAARARARASGTPGSTIRPYPRTAANRVSPADPQLAAKRGAPADNENGKPNADGKAKAALEPASNQNRNP